MMMMMMMMMLMMMMMMMLLLLLLESLKLPFQISTFPRREIPMTPVPFFWKDLVLAVKTLQSQFQILQAEKRQARHRDLRIWRFMMRPGRLKLIEKP